MAFQKIRAAGEDDDRLTFESLCDSLGSDLAQRLVDAFGGYELRIPKHRLSDTHRLVIALGRDDADAVQADLSGIQLSIPRRPVKEVSPRNLEILACVKSGMARGAVGQRYQLTQRHVRRILSKLRAEGYEIEASG